ncbi:HAMP domain-containing protein [Salinisphaera sp. USBA-960]|uniref:ATP-binding protein n=1 Tax=Salinisphaera orenii TaxID=856731 RepID=UPI000DBE1C94|nr:HAMP domain-containing protein [Salifodinibacter halophilus]NNC26033.1 HAMP domain-containing protein [Salifodinibacter halophilus]
MSLRWRLLLTLGISFCVLWLGVAAWLYSDLRQQMHTTLDQRLAASARMVAGLVAQMPTDTWKNTGSPGLSTPLYADIACQIRSARGHMLVRTHGDFDEQLDTPKPGYTNRVIDGQRWRLFTYVESGLYITTADRLANRHTLQRNIVLVAVIPFVVALVGTLLVLWLGIRRGLRPLEQLRRALSQRTPDALEPIEITHTPAELAPAIETLNHLLVRTDHVLAREQRFTSEVAHELRTPLTAIKTHVQLASRVESDRAEQVLADAEAGIARLQRTLEQLLLLARMEETGSSDGDAHTASACEVAVDACADLPGAARIHVPETIPAINLALPPALAAAALRNLLDNALRHSPVDACVELSVTTTTEHIEFLVADRGDWPEHADTTVLTQRFWRAATERDRSSGSGLGLTIVAAIAARFGGDLDFETRSGGGLNARLRLARLI